MPRLRRPHAPPTRRAITKIICPVASGHLPVRSEWLDLYSQTYTDENVKEHFKAMVDDRNKLYNPNGRPYCDKTRSATVAGLPDGPQDTGAKIPEDSSAPKIAEELTTTKDGLVSMITVRGHHLHFTKSGHLWVRGTSDDVLPRGLCLALMYGKFFVNEHVAAEQAKQASVCIDLNMPSESHDGDLL